MKINSTSPNAHTFLSPLGTIAIPPKKLYYQGILPAERTPTVAIVGSRKPTAYGVEVTQLLAYGLAQQGIPIVSGLALGVDGIAHRAALEAGGITLAVLANGLPHIYPASHRDLAARILQQGGALISEYAPETSARPYQFLARNRLVSGLADAVIITEAAARSGTLNTALHALEQGKELFVVPGNITSPMSAGCNALIAQGALVATSVEDVMSVIAPTQRDTQAPLPLGATPAETAVIAAIQQGIRDGDTLQQATRLDAHTFSTTLSMLEINGIIKSLGGNRWTLR